MPLSLTSPSPFLNSPKISDDPDGAYTLKSARGDIEFVGGLLGGLSECSPRASARDPACLCGVVVEQDAIPEELVAVDAVTFY